METRYGIEALSADLDEASLVDRARYDPVAFGELYDRLPARIYRFAYGRLRERVGAEDLTADVFVLALKGIRSYVNVGRPFGAWLHRIEVNALLYRSRRRATVSLDAMVDLPDRQSDSPTRSCIGTGCVPSGSRSEVCLRSSAVQSHSASRRICRCDLSRG